MRACVVVLGPLVARYGRARVSLPGGCAIGARPIDQHLKGLEALGAEIELPEGYVEARAKRLKGGRSSPSTASPSPAPRTCMMAAALAEGRTLHRERGARARGRRAGAGAQQDGRAHRRRRQRRHHHRRRRRAAARSTTPSSPTASRPAPAGGRGHHRRRRAGARAPCPSTSRRVIEKLRETGCHGRRLKATAFAWWAPSASRPVDLKTQAHPGFPTDMQAQLMALLASADGTSVIAETIFENRFMHVAELRRMGADITVDGHTAVVRGAERLSGAPVMATDLRASASLVLAGLAAEGSDEDRPRLPPGPGLRAAREEAALPWRKDSPSQGPVGNRPSRKRATTVIAHPRVPPLRFRPHPNRS